MKISMVHAMDNSNKKNVYHANSEFEIEHIYSEILSSEMKSHQDHELKQNNLIAVEKQRMKKIEDLRDTQKNSKVALIANLNPRIIRPKYSKPDEIQKNNDKVYESLSNLPNTIKIHGAPEMMNGVYTRVNDATYG